MEGEEEVVLRNMGGVLKHAPQGKERGRGKKRGEGEGAALAKAPETKEEKESKVTVLPFLVSAHLMPRI